MANRETSTQGANMSNDFEHAQRIIKSQSESIENLIKTISTYIEICDIRQTTIKRLQDENESWMNLTDKYLDEIRDLEDLNDSYKETIKDLNDRLTDKYKLFRPTVPDMNQVNESLDREPEEIDGLRRILEQLHNERLGINPVV
jgi:DNA repair ATPase RecN